MTPRSFASDNNAPIAPEILQAILDANEGDAVGYGDDPWTARAIARFREHFGAETDVYFTFNGTGANIVALSCVLRPWEAVLAPSTAHLQVDECGALERFAGSKVIPISTPDGKLRIADIEPYLLGTSGEHHPQPRAISISNTTEWGDVYERDEVRELCTFAHERDLLVHVDGARIANAAAALGTTPRAITQDIGVDVLTFGGTKNGLLGGEAVCFFNPRLSANVGPYVHKQAMQLASKMRYISAQFEALLTDERWLNYASHANAMAQRLLAGVANIPGVKVTRPVRANAIFATMDRAAIARVQKQFFFFCFDEAKPEVRWMTHWATTEADIDAFVEAVREAI
ncbi:MAG TPA: aminotransferase class I/II-fold pyridoxal phosphate-dependent enzyme [Candidatus Aquilonibacter sp.]